MTVIFIFINVQRIHKYVNTYLLGGFALLCQVTVRRRESFLSQEQSLAFKEVILTKRPFEVLGGEKYTSPIYYRRKKGQELMGS